MDAFRFVRQFFLVFSVLAASAGLGSVAWAQDAEVTGDAVASVNINSASAEEIAAVLVGVGEKRAQAIVKYRDDNGDFESLADLQEVNGIGEVVAGNNAGRIDF